MPVPAGAIHPVRDSGRVTLGLFTLPHRPAPVPGAARSLVIGLVNNMPPTARGRTACQFSRLISLALPTMAVEWHHDLLADDPTVKFGAGASSGPSAAVRRLESCPPDLLIVTGREPTRAALPDEPFWNELVTLLDLAERAGIPVLLSCLAAHAALLHWNGIVRRRLPAKLSGVFAHRTAARHPLLAGAPAVLHVPHSRTNDIDPAALEAAGYVILTRGEATGADMFVHSRGGGVLCLQGHPEYDPDTLLREHRRDVHRYLRGELPQLPDLPHNVVDARVGSELAILASRAGHGRDASLIANYLDRLPHRAGEHSWDDAATVVGNWLRRSITAIRIARAIEAAAVDARAAASLR